MTPASASARVADHRGDGGDGQQADDGGAAGQAVEAVDDVDGVGDAADGEGGEEDGDRGEVQQQVDAAARPLVAGRRRSTSRPGSRWPWWPAGGLATPTFLVRSSSRPDQQGGDAGHQDGGEDARASGLATSLDATSKRQVDADAADPRGGLEWNFWMAPGRIHREAAVAVGGEHEQPRHQEGSDGAGGDGKGGGVHDVRFDGQCVTKTGLASEAAR